MTAPRRAETIEDVLALLRVVVDEAVAAGSRTGFFAAQEIKPQARVLASDRGIACAVVDYDALRGMDDPSLRLF